MNNHRIVETANVHRGYMFNGSGGIIGTANVGDGFFGWAQMDNEGHVGTMGLAGLGWARRRQMKRTA